METHLGCSRAERRGESSVWAVEWRAMSLDDYGTVLYRNPPGGWVAEIPALPGCYALMDTKEAALHEIANVFEMIAEEYGERGECLPVDNSLIHT